MLAGVWKRLKEARLKNDLSRVRRMAVSSRFTNVVVSEGDPKHKHNFEMIPWDPALGEDFVKIDTSGYLARYGFLYLCPCGRKEALYSTGLI